LAFGAIAPAAASARLNLNPARPATTPSSRSSVQIVRVAAPGGFDWGDAGIGAAAAFGLSMLAVGGGVALITQRRRTPRMPGQPRDRTLHQEGTRELSQGPDAKSNLL
jgi:hypothetical protein